MNGLHQARLAKRVTEVIAKTVHSPSGKSPRSSLALLDMVINSARKTTQLSVYPDAFALLELGSPYWVTILVDSLIIQEGA